MFSMNKKEKVLPVPAPLPEDDGIANPQHTTAVVTLYTWLFYFLFLNFIFKDFSYVFNYILLIMLL